MFKRFFLLSVLTISLTSFFAQANNDVTKKSCEKLDQKIEKQNSKLKAGVSNKKSEKIKEKLHKLHKNKFACKQKGFKTK
ncbi:hypothetical protein SAMN05660429_02024 [Thalassotalea agarivorans]|uniref:Uncharacterized protein n=1 Tax=Thalassotalea agarivorans TaxID=349064 RepID=A0A1I0F0Y2_THASX|nr:hypothetical protein SAMN05660429_02024 [Thalassotalea agarivorans]